MKYCIFTISYQFLKFQIFCRRIKLVGNGMPGRDEIVREDLGILYRMRTRQWQSTTPWTVQEKMILELSLPPILTGRSHLDACQAAIIMTSLIPFLISSMILRTRRQGNVRMG